MNKKCGRVLPSAQFFYYFAIIFFLVRIKAIAAILYLLAVCFLIFRVAAAVINIIKGTKAKQTVYMFCIVTWIKFAVTIFKV